MTLTLFLSGDDFHSTCKTVSMELSNLNNWFAINKLSLNVAKTNFMVFSNRTVPNDIEVTINNYKIDQVHTTKFVGMVIDDKLNWKEHVLYVNKKNSKSLCVMCKVKSYLNEEALLSLYNTRFEPYLNYYSEVWGLAGKTILSKINIYQNMCIRMVCKVSRNSHTTNLFKKLKILKFRDKVDYKILQLMYKVKQKSLPTNIQILFEINYGKYYNTRQLNKFYVTYSRTVLKSRCLSIYGVKMWNNLDVVARNCLSFLAFITYLQMKFLEKY